jgi:class 3 adenylate cyclase/tetratricopeptide (TPR) repeat protein
MTGRNQQEGGDGGGAAQDGALHVGDVLSRSLGRAERRQLVVLFCDIVGSSALAQHYDPETVSTLLGTYRRGVADVVTALGGSVLRYVGDGVLAVWGYPLCSPEDCSKAVTAALDIVANRPQDTALRVAVDAGIVVVGDIGVSANGEAEIVGQAPNRAARLQSLAAANSVVISGAVRRLLGPAYVYADLPVPVPAEVAEEGAWRVTERRSVPRRHVAPPREIVGRHEERGVLGSLWSDSDAPRVVCISGPAGIGKSALAGWTIEQAVRQGIDVIAVDCLPEQRNSTLHVARGLLGAVLERLEPSGAPIGERLAAALGETAAVDRGALDRAVHILQPAPGRSSHAADAGADPQRGRVDREAEIELAALIVGILARIADVRPLLLVIEDLHWSDAESLRLLSAMLARTTGLTCDLRVVATCRTGQGCWSLDGMDWGQHGIALDRLADEDIAAIAAAVLGDSGETSHNPRTIAERSGGNPLLAVELARLRPAEQNRILDGEGIAPPSMLNAVLCMRLDELGRDKPLVQAASVLGRQFDRRLLADVVGMDRWLIARELARLASSGVIVPTRADDGYDWKFSHGLLREVAYATLLRETRERLHGRAVDILVERFQDVAEREPELVAGHATAARRFDEAFVWWSKAAARAVSVSSTQAAIQHGERALSALALGRNAGNAREEIELLNLLAPQLAALYGNASPRVLATYQRCIALADSIPDVSPKLTFQLVWGLQTCASVSGRIPEALTASERLVAMAEQMGSDGARVLAYRVRGLSELLAGRPRQASEKFTVVHALYDVRRHAGLRQRFAADQGAIALAHDALALSVAGEEEEARRRARAALAHAADLAHPHTSVHVACILAARAQMAGDLEAARALAGGALVMARMNKFPYWDAWARILVGWLEGQSAPDRGMAAIRQGIEIYTETGAALMLPYARLLLADLLLSAGRPTAASGTVSEALRRSAASGLDLWTAPLLLTLADAAEMLGHGANAAALEAQADVVIARQGSVLFRRRHRRRVLPASSPPVPSAAADVARRALALLGPMVKPDWQLA